MGLGRRPAPARARPSRRPRPARRARLAQAGAAAHGDRRRARLALVLARRAPARPALTPCGSSAGAAGATGATRSRRTARTTPSPSRSLALFQDWHQQLHQRLHRRLLFGQPYLALEEHVAARRRRRRGDARDRLPRAVRRRPRRPPRRHLSAQPDRPCVQPALRAARARHRLAPRDRAAAQAPRVHRHRQHRHPRPRRARDRGPSWPRWRRAGIRSPCRRCSRRSSRLRARRALAVRAPRAPGRPPRRAPARSAPPRRSRRPRCAPRSTPRTAAVLVRAARRLDAVTPPAGWSPGRSPAAAGERAAASATPASPAGCIAAASTLARPRRSPWRNGVVSAAEAATLWQLPSPRLGHIRLARHTIPRAPAPPDVARAPVPAPPTARRRAATHRRRASPGRAPPDEATA